MKALSIQQPWAWLIVNGHKDIENRTWETNYRGPIVVHTGKKFDREGYNFVATQTDIDLPMPDEFKLGGIVGTVEITDCVDHHDSPWFFGPYGFVLESPKKVMFREFPGRLGLFNISDELVRFKID